MKKLIAIVLSSIVLFGCIKNNDDKSSEDSIIKVKSVTLSESSLKMETTDVVKLIASILPKDASNKSIKWTSSDDGVVKVDQEGNLEAIDIGKVLIVARTNNNKLCSCSVEVTQKAIPVTDIILSPESKILKVGKYFYLKAQVVPENHTEGDMGLSIPSREIVNIDNTGKIIGIAPGVVDIQVYSENVRKVCKVTVVK